jgi:hypothetical protein
MNIFYLDNDTATCAEMHNDKHVVKMILEYAQLLSTAHRVLDGTIIDRLSPSGRKQKAYVLADNRESALYSATHINHPSAVWVRKTHQNYMWLADLLGQLCSEYTHRYEKTHKVERDGLLKVLQTNLPKKIPIGPFTQPTPAMPDEVKIAGDSIKSYRNYYINNKAHLASWKKRSTPGWYNANI